MNSIDLRSDTLTKPSPEMLDAMMKAKVGDDVFGEDETVNMLQQKAAELFGMEAALFCPSGTMTNQIAIKIHTQAGDEVMCDKLSHIYLFEGGGIAANSGASVRLLDGNLGRFSSSQVLENINKDDAHFPRTKLVSIENTVNRGGGSIWDFEEIKKIKASCISTNLSLHLDGARLFNALVETKETTIDYGKIFDTISICLSKGLGAPVGSLLLGNQQHIYKAKRVRKIFGGGMRQAGYLAAAGIFALDNNISRLKIDHVRAKEIEKILSQKNFVSEVFQVQTNIVIFKLNETISTEIFLKKLSDQNIKAVSIGKNLIRFVLHLDVSEEMFEQLKTTISEINF